MTTDMTITRSIDTTIDSMDLTTGSGIIITITIIIIIIITYIIPHHSPLPAP